MRYCVRFSYLGTDFHGSQSQPNGITVQEVMEQAFTTVLRYPVTLTFAGRTDAGVHARQMYAHWDAPEGLTPYSAEELVGFIGRLNSLLPASVAVDKIVPVAHDWHARFSAISRTYDYVITTTKDPFLCGRAARVAPGLDYPAMNRAAQLLIGRHDFASFCKVHTDVKTTFCTITQAQWTIMDNGTAVFRISADRFLRNMVRAVVGTLFMVGRGKLSLTEFSEVIASRNRCQAGQSAPAEGLYLVRVEYPEE